MSCLVLSCLVLSWTSDIDESIAKVLGKSKKGLKKESGLSVTQFSAVISMLEDVVDENAGITVTDDNEDEDDQSNDDDDDGK